MAEKRSMFSTFFTTPEPTHYDSGTIASVGRPRDVRAGRPVHQFEMGYAVPRNPISYITLFQTMYLSLPWRFAILIKTQEKYRRGISPYPLFSSKCLKCGMEYQDVNPDQKCRVKDCDGELRGPDPKEKKRMEKQQENMNLNNECLEDIMQQCSPDICVVDEGYVVLRKEYYVDKKTKEVDYFKVKETIWASPIVMRPVVDPHTGTPGGMFWVCPQCRGRKGSPVHMRKKATEETRKFVDANSEVDTDNAYETAPFCNVCGTKMMDVKYVSIFHERGYIENYYISGEVIHWHEYSKSHTFSSPPGTTLWVPASIIVYKDTYIRDSFMKQRKPRGAIVVQTSNPGGFMNKWDRVMERVKKDWGYMPVIPLEPEVGISGGASRVQWVDFMGTMQDLDYENIRSIYERNIMQFYGVGNIFANIEAKGTSKGSEETKLIISNRHREWSNRNDDRVLRIISQQYGYRDHVWRINAPEDRDEAKQEQLFTQRITNAQLLESIGYKAALDEQRKLFSYRYDAQKEMNEAMQLITALIGLKTQAQPPVPPPTADGNPGDDEKQSISAKPKVDSAEFTGTATDGDLNIDKAQTNVGDVRIHEGDNKPTPASGHKTAQTGGPAGGYYAPDGTGPFKSKQALGGYLRTKGSQHGQGMGPGGAGAGGGGGGPQGPGGGMGMGMMQPQATKEDYKKAIKLIRERKYVEDEVLDMIEEFVDEMEDIPNGSGDGGLQGPETVSGGQVPDDSKAVS